MKLDLRGTNHQIIATVEAKRFKHTIGDTDYWLAFHEDDRTRELIISDPKTGFRVTKVGYGERFHAYKGDDRQAVRAAMNKVIARHGVEKVRHVLDHGITKSEG